jgi:hypothetical protein
MKKAAPSNSKHTLIGLAKNSSDMSNGVNNAKNSITRNPSLRSNSKINTSHSVKEDFADNKSIRSGRVSIKSPMMGKYLDTNHSQKKGNKFDYRDNKSHISEKSKFDNSFEKIINTGKESMKEIIEGNNIEYKMNNLIEETIELFHNQSLTLNSAKEEKEKYELIEKTVWERLKKDNEEYKQSKSQMIDEYNKTVESYNKVSGELNFMTQTYTNKEKIKHEHVNKIYRLNDKLKELQVSNYKIDEMIRREKVEKENIFRSLLAFTKKYNSKLPQELKETYNKFNTEYYTSAFKVDEDYKLDALKAKVEKCESELKEKTSELEKLRELLSMSIENKEDN